MGVISDAIDALEDWCCDLFKDGIKSQFDGISVISPKPCLSHALQFPAQKPYTAPHNSPNSLPTIYRQPTLLNYLLFSPSAHSKSIRHTVSEVLSSEPGWGQGES